MIGPLIFSAVMVIGVFFLSKRDTRFGGYLITLALWETFGKYEIGYTEAELCLNDIIVLLIFILFELWNKFRRE